MCNKISTFVFFDTETTGLPIYENNQTKITELSLVAVTKDDISKTPFGSVPEVVKRLSVLLNPQRTISSEAVKLNGLTNDYLKNAPTFAEKFNEIHDFFDDLSKPVCLIAHNGDNFDYGILLAECEDANVKLPSDLFCYDSKVAFRSILTGTNTSFESLSLKQQSEIENSRDTNITTAEVVKQSSATEVETETKQNTSEDKSVQQESAPETQNVSPETATQRVFTSERTTPDQTSSESGLRNDMNATKSKRQEFSWNSFSLENLYKRLTNKVPNNAHRAEADCFILLECVVALKSEFIALSESSCKLLTEIPPLVRQ